jgi:hypothetical protein
MSNNVVTIVEDDVYLWIEQEDTIHLRATHKGDPVELTPKEARRLAEALVRLADKIDSDDARFDRERKESE